MVWAIMWGISIQSPYGISMLAIPLVLGGGFSIFLVVVGIILIIVYSIKGEHMIWSIISIPGVLFVVVAIIWLLELL